jgi:selenocysteine lyase/cysteine desulfurase
MSNSISLDPTLAALQEDVSALKRDIGTLLTHLKSSASASAQSAADQIEEGATRIYRTASVEGTKTAKALGQQIEEQPVMAVLLVLALGYVGGRLLSR